MMINQFHIGKKNIVHMPKIKKLHAIRRLFLNLFITQYESTFYDIAITLNQNCGTIQLFVRRQLKLCGVCIVSVDVW